MENLCASCKYLLDGHLICQGRALVGSGVRRLESEVGARGLLSGANVARPLPDVGLGPGVWLRPGDGLGPGGWLGPTVGFGPEVCFGPGVWLGPAAGMRVAV